MILVSLWLVEVPDGSLFPVGIPWMVVDSVKASKLMFKCAGVKLNQLEATHEKIELSFDVNDI